MKKRICAVLMSLLLAVNLVGVPKAKAVVSEGALLGSIFGSLLVSMGYSWAADNMDVPTFGESIYKLTQDFDEAMKDTGIQLIRDLSLAGLTANGAGKLQFGYAWVQAARSFAEWFEGKFFTGDNSSAVVSPGMKSITFIDGTTISLGSVIVGDSVFSAQIIGGDVIPAVESSTRVRFRLTDDYYIAYQNYSDASYWYFPLFRLTSEGGWELGNRQKLSDYPTNPYEQAIHFGVDDNYLYFGHTVNTTKGVEWNTHFVPLDELTLSSTPALSAEKPQEVHYPDVAEDGSQVYEITVDGVTATDIEGIIQGAVDRILAGTAAIAGEVAQAQDVPVTPEAPAAGEYAVPGLESIFPFCIPFDIYAFCSALNAEPVAPSFEWRMQYAPLGLDYTFEIDLSDFDGVAQVLRTMELLAFCVGLAFWTRHLIRG